MNTRGSIIEGDLHGFFGDLLVSASANQKLLLSEKARGYVTDLLVHFQDTEHLFSQEGVRIPILADMLHQAIDADFHRRVSILRQMGDTSLMVSGFFPEALTRRAVDLNYYQRMGETAYQQLSSLTTQVNVYDELSERFIKLANVLNEISEQVHGKNNSLSKLLEFYSATGSERALEQLRKQGVIPIQSKDDPFENE